MQIHDWTKIFAGAFHDFHQSWVVEIRNQLNAGLLPDGFYAAAEQVTGKKSPDVVTLEEWQPKGDDGGSDISPDGGTLIVKAPPKVRYEFECELRHYSRKADRIAIRHISDNRVVAIIEVISPGNKHNQQAMQQLRDKVYALIDNDIQLLLINLIPPGNFDPDGLPRALSIVSDDIVPAVTSEEPLSLLALQVKPVIRGYVELCRAGGTLPDMPLFLSSESYVNLPLAESYEAAFRGVPKPWKQILEGEA